MKSLISTSQVLLVSPKDFNDLLVRAKHETTKRPARYLFRLRHLAADGTAFCGGVGGTGWDLPVPFTPTGGVGNGGFPSNLVLGSGVPVDTVVVGDGCFPSPDPNPLVVTLVAVRGV